ncbi:MAG: DUF2357 domain-containing protein [Deltaproteobacteria bacterium]
MAPVDHVELPLVDPTNTAIIGSLRISVLGRDRNPTVPPLLDLRADPPTTLEPVQLVEGVEYRYEVDLPGPVRIEPDDLISADDASGRTGRLRPREHTGRLPIGIVVGGRRLDEVAVEVRSKKLGYLDDYRNMLEDIANVATELVLRRFAATEQRLRPDTLGDPHGLHAQFRLVRAMLMGTRLRGALAVVLARPHVEWREYPETVLPGQPLRATSRVARLIAKPGPKQPWPGREPLMRPADLERLRHEETTDSIPNRFVRFVLEEWRAVTWRLRDALLAEKTGTDRRIPAAVNRGLRETEEVDAVLNDLLRHPVLRNVEDLVRFPVGNQVLERRPGYRELFEAFLLSQVGAQLEWQGGEDVYGAGQRDVATLYEYWVFLRLAGIVARLSGQELDVESLVRSTTTGVDFALRRGRRAAVRALVARLGRRMALDLVYERSYELGDGTWSRSMRPDCSLEVRLLEPAGAWTTPVRLHFDAKYRVERAVDALGEETTRVPPADITKMHAYRDAILGAVGAYAVYPGADVEVLRKHGELLPSLGAFPLKPGPDREGIGEEAIVRFLDDVIVHLANQASAHERARYWESVSYTEEGFGGPQRVVPWWSRPPADLRALFVRDIDGLEDWAHEHRCWPVPSRPGGGLGLEIGELDVSELVVCDGAGVVRAAYRVEGEARLVSGASSASFALEGAGVRGARYQVNGEAGFVHGGVGSVNTALGVGLFLGVPIGDSLDLPAWLVGLDLGPLFGLDLGPLFEAGARRAIATRWLDVLRRFV